MVALDVRPPLGDEDRRRRTTARRPGDVVASRAACGGVGAALLFLVARDGSPGWQLLRLLAAAGALSLAVLAVGRGGRGLRAATEFSLGCLAAAVGIGIGLPHLAKAGLSPMAVAGITSLAGGLVLLTIGGAALVRAVRPWRRIAVVPALLAAVLVSVWSLGQSVAATNVPRTEVGRTTPADLGLAYRDVTFATTDGVTLSGWFVASTSGAAVVLLHGSGSTRSAVLDHAVVLARHGFGVLLFDARGHGRSGGRAMDFGWYGDEDTAAAVSFLQAQRGIDGARIGAVGLSMGGEEAIGAAAADPRIRAVVAEGATNRVARDKAWLSEEFGARGAVQEGIERLLYGVTDLLTAADQPAPLREAASVAAPRPMLLIAGGARPDEGRAGRHIRAGSPETVQLWVVPDAGHTKGLVTHPREWEERVTSFLSTALGSDGREGPS